MMNPVQNILNCVDSLKATHDILTQISYERDYLTESEYSFTLLALNNAGSSINSNALQLVPSLESELMVSVEGILGNIGSAIVAGAKTAWEFLLKFIKSVGAFVTNIFNKIRGIGQRAQKVVDQCEKLKRQGHREFYTQPALPYTPGKKDSNIADAGPDRKSVVSDNETYFKGKPLEYPLIDFDGSAGFFGRVANFSKGTSAKAVAENLVKLVAGVKKSGYTKANVIREFDYVKNILKTEGRAAGPGEYNSKKQLDGKSTFALVKTIVEDVLKENHKIEIVENPTVEEVMEVFILVKSATMEYDHKGFLDAINLSEKLSCEIFEPLMKAGAKEMGEEISIEQMKEAKEAIYDGIEGLRMYANRLSVVLNCFRFTS